MNIDLRSNRAIVFGATMLSEEEDGVCPARFSPEINWQPASEFMTGCSSGIRLAFQTDAEALKLTVRLGRSIFEFGRGAFDLRVNGLFVKTFLPDGPWEDGQVFSFEHRFGTGVKNLTLYFPLYRKTTVKSLELPGAAFCKASARPTERILFFGDSITQGYAATPSMSYAARAARALGFDFLNLGIGGAQMPDRIPDGIFKLDWSVAVVALGTNDANQRRDPEAFRRATIATLNAFTHDPSRRTILITPIYWPSGMAARDTCESLTHLTRILRETAAAEYGDHLKLIDGSVLVPHHDCLFVDGTHPNSEGMAFYAENLLKAW